MTWTRGSWTPRLSAALRLGCAAAGQVITDQPARAGGLDQAAPAGRSSLRLDPRHPSTPGTPARGRACLAARLHGTRQTWGGARKKGEACTGGGGSAR
jgi:hypothetical protein